MSDDWKPGDIGMCVNDGPLHCGHGLHDAKNSVKRGAIVTVTDVSTTRAIVGYGRCTCECIIFGAGAGLSKRFVKVSPGHKIEGSEVDQKEPWLVEA